MDEYQANLISEMSIALDKIGLYPANVAWHCGRLAYLAYAFSRYNAFVQQEPMDFETDYKPIAWCEREEEI